MGIFFKSKKQKEAEKIGPALLQTAKDCADRVNTTGSPETFFQSYEQMLASLESLVKIQYSLKIKGQLPSDILRTIQDKKPFTIEEFLERYYRKIQEKIEKQKDIAHKKKVAQQFAEKLHPYLHHFAARNKKQLQTYCNKISRQLETATTEKEV